MGWLIELLFESIRELCSQFIVDMMDIASSMFTEILSCDLDLFEELFGVAGDLYRNAVLPIAIALLLMILTWQVFKSMFGKLGASSEDPLELVFRSAFCLFMLVYARDIVNYILELAGTPYQWVVGTDITVDSFSGYVSAAEAAVSALGVDAISISMLLLIMHFVVAWNYFKLLFILAERYVLLGVFSYTAPLAFATGGAKATGNILASWTKMFGGQVLLVILDAWCLKMFLSGYGNLMASGYGFTKFFAATMCLIGFCKIAGKLDSYMASMGVSMGRTMGGLSGLGALMMAGRLLQGGGKAVGGSLASAGSGHMNFGGGKSIPLGSRGHASAADAMSATGDGMGAGIGGMSAGSAAADVAGMEKEPDHPNMGDGFDVFQPEDAALGGQNLPFGEPDDTAAFSSEMEDGMTAPFGVEEEVGERPGMEADAGIPFGDGNDTAWDESFSAGAGFQTDGEVLMSEGMDGGVPTLPFGDVEDISAGMETGETAGISGWESMGESGLPDMPEGSVGISSIQDRAEISSSGLGTGLPSYSGADVQEISGTAGGNQNGSSGIGGTETSLAGSTGSLGGTEISGTGQASAMADAGGLTGSGSADSSQSFSGTESLAGTGMESGTGSHIGMAEKQMQEAQRGFYQAERDGRQYMRFDAGLYEKPKGPYQTIHENGRTFYELPKQAETPALRPETKAVLEKDGTLRLEKVYHQKERTEKPGEQKIPEKPAEKKPARKQLKKQTGARRRNRRKDNS